MKTITRIRHWFLIAFMTWATFVWSRPVIAQDGGEGPTTQPSPAAVTATYETRCANCHGSAGQGNGPQAIQANLPVPDLTDPTILRETTPARWYGIISNGVDGAAMPPFGEESSNPLRQIDRWNLAFYLYTLGTPPTQVAMGQALYESFCADCHGTDGAGTAGSPGFTDLAKMAGKSQVDLFSAAADSSIEGHDLGMGDVELWAVTDYVRTFSYNYASPPTTDATSETSAPAVLSPFSGGSGVISGQVRNGTPGASIPDDLVVSLRAFDMNASFVDLITTTIATDGTFRFDGIDATVPAQYEPLAVYEDIPYFGGLDSAIVLSEQQPEVDVDIVVYETTEDSSDVRIERLHMVLDFEAGQMQVAELYILSNDGDKAFVGTVEDGTLPITDPPNSLSFRPGGDSSRYLTLADGIADTVPIPPGVSTAESVVVYNLAYDGDLELSRPLPYDVDTVNILVPAEAGVEVTGDGIRPGGPFQARGASLDMFLADDLSAGSELRFRVSGEPLSGLGTIDISPHRASGPDQTTSTVIGLIVLAGSVALAIAYWQGWLNSRFKPGARDRQAILLQTIADLDDEYDAGRIAEKPYRAKRSELKEELQALMAAEGPTPMQA
jgi:mono/diheme cytochrome c family protein